MKGNIISVTGLALLALIATTMSGCVSMMASSPQMADTKNYVRQHKGEGARQSLLGSEAELMDSVEKLLREAIVYTIVREPHAVFATGNSGLAEVSYAFYFYPSQANGKTEVEILMAAPIMKVETLRQWEKGAFETHFPLAYINTKLLEEGYDPNVKEGSMLALSSAALYDSREIAKKLIRKGANLDLAINELKERASYTLSLINNPDFAAHVQKLRITYDKWNSSLELLKGLTQFADRVGRKSNQSEAEKENDARFKEALRAYQPAAVKPAISESARRFKVQAEDAVREKKFDDAAELYRQALNIAPVWPEGRFNRALVLGEIGDYETAVHEMKRYLLLVPNASNVRAAQDKIYIWERKAGGGD